MIIHCVTCDTEYDDEFRLTFCPHDTFLANDGENNRAHHPESHYVPPTPKLIAIDTDPEFFHGLTMFANPNVYVQMRQSEVAIGFMPAAPRSTEDGHPYTITLDEARKLRDLLNVATARGAL